MPVSQVGGATPSNFYDPVDIGTINTIQRNLKKASQTQRRYLIAVSYLPDTVLSPVTLAEILVQQSNNMKLNPAEPGYANKVLFMREKARNLVYYAAIRKASAVVDMKLALGTKGPIQLNSATRLAIKLAQPALKTVDSYYTANFNELVPNSEHFHISPHIKVTLHDDVPDEDLNVHGSFNSMVQNMIADNFKPADMNGKSNAAKALRVKRTEFDREVFIISRLISAADNNTVRPRIVLNLSKEENDTYIKVKPKHDSYSLFKPATKNNPSISNVLHLAEHTVDADATTVPEFQAEGYEEWKVRTITLADIAFIVKNGIINSFSKKNVVHVSVFGIAPFINDDEVQFNDLAVCFSDSSLFRHLTPGAALTVRDMYSNPSFTDERLETCLNLFGTKYKYGLITHNDILHYKKGDNYLPESARKLINRITATNKLSVTFLNVQDVLIKADANGDVLNTLEVGDQDQVERALMSQNEKSDFSLEYISVFVDLINKYGTPSADHVADTSIPAAISQALRNDELALGTLKTKVELKKEISVIMENVMRNDRGMTMRTPNLTEGQLKLDGAKITFSVVGDYTKTGTEVTERRNLDEIELINATANYTEGEDSFEVIDTFVNRPINILDNSQMNTIELDFNFDTNTLPISYNEYVNGVCYGNDFNTTLNSAIPIATLITGANVGVIPNADLYAVRTGGHNLVVMPGATINANHIEITFNRYKLYESNGEVETLYFNHVGIEHKARIAIIINQNVAKKTVRVKKLADEYKVSLKVKENFKLQDFMNIKYLKNFDTNNLLMNNSYSLAGIEYQRRVEIAQQYSTLNITSEYYKHLKEFAIKIVMDLSVLQNFFRLFTNVVIYEYSKNDMLAAHITSYKAKFVSLSEKETIIVHDIIFATITAIITKYDANVLPGLEALSEKKLDGTMTDSERDKYARIIAEHPVACWTAKVTRSYSVPDQIRNIYKEIMEGGTNG